MSDEVKALPSVQGSTVAGQLIFLSHLLVATKKSEEHERQERIKIEEQIAALIPGPKCGSKTVTLEDGTKLTVERGFNYKADCQKIEEVMQNPLSPPPIKVKTTRELDVTGYEWYRQNHPTLFNVISQHVTVTLKKIAISIKEKA